MRILFFTRWLSIALSVLVLSVAGRSQQPTGSENNSFSPSPAVHVSELPPVTRPAPPNTGNPEMDKKYLRQQQKLLAKQEKERKKLQRRQEEEHQQIVRLAEEQKQVIEQQMELEHQQQTQRLVQEEAMQERKLRAQQESHQTKSPQKPSESADGKP